MEENYINGLAENKVLLLYIINSIVDDFTDNDLIKMIAEINNINYFYFRDILDDLINSKLVETYTKDEQKLLEITDKGKQSLELTIDNLPGILKLKTDNVLKNRISIVADEKAVTAEYIPESETDYTVKCKIVENNKTIFELTTFAGSNEHAKKIADNWKQNANILYPKILDLLN